MTNTRFTPIKGTASDYLPASRQKGVRELTEEDREEITRLLLHHTVTKVDGEHIQLDNGTVIKAIGREGGCSCGGGDYELAELNGVPNLITRVEFDYRPDEDDWSDAAEDDDEETGFYRIFVYAGNEKINLMQFNGTDGSGYYGTGYSILVRDAEKPKKAIDA